MKNLLFGMILMTVASAAHAQTASDAFYQSNKSVCALDAQAGSSFQGMLKFVQSLDYDSITTPPSANMVKLLNQLLQELHYSDGSLSYEQMREVMIHKHLQLTASVYKRAEDGASYLEIKSEEIGPKENALIFAPNGELIARNTLGGVSILTPQGSYVCSDVLVK